MIADKSMFILGCLVITGICLAVYFGGDHPAIYSIAFAIGGPLVFLSFE